MKYLSAVIAVTLCVAAGCDSSSSSSGEQLAAPISAEPSNGPNVLPKPATSTQPAEPTPACDPERVIDLNRAAMPTGDGGFLIPTEHGVRNDFIGECGGDGKEQVFKFTAGAGGLWIFTVETDDLYLDTILYARSTCDDEETEIACNDDIVDNEILQSQLNLRLAKGATIFVYADSYAGEGGTFNLRVRTVPEKQNGEACDVTGQTNVCPESSFCRVDQDSPGAEGVCSADEPASVTQVRAYRNGDALQLGVDGTDSGGDVTRANLQLFGPPQMRCVGTNDDGSDRVTNASCSGSNDCQSGETCKSVDIRIQLNSQGADTYILQPVEPVFGLTTFTFKWASDVLENFPQTTRVRVRFEDSKENQGEWSAVTPIENIPQGTAEKCDQARILDTCPSGQACLDLDENGIFGCTAVTAPVLDKVKVYYSAESKLMAVEASGTDVDRDIRGVQVNYLDVQGSVVGSITYKFDFIEREGDAYTGYASFEVDSTSPPVATRIKSYDEERILSNEQTTDMFLEAMTASEGQACDVRGARAPCGEGLFCYPPEADAQNVCGKPLTECPSDWGDIIKLNDIGRDGEWRLTGDLTGRGNVTVGSCGGGSAQVIYEFTAPAEATYSVYARSRAPGSDPVLYMRSHCSFGADVPQFELGCNDDISDRSYSSLLRTKLAEGQTVYIFVDGAQSRQGPWRGPYNLIVRQLP